MYEKLRRFDASWQFGIFKISGKVAIFIFNFSKVGSEFATIAFFFLINDESPLTTGYLKNQIRLLIFPLFGGITSTTPFSSLFL